MPHYDFLEIGTSNFDTLIQKASDSTVGISVEPIARYLNQLPNKKNVIKINAAISFDDTETTALVYYIPEDVIRKHKLSKWLIGCNCVNNYHPNHLDKKHLVVTEEISQIPIKKIFIDYDITSLDLLKIDTEGSDTKILKNLYNFLKNDDKYHWPKEIIFETNKLTPKEDVDDIIKIFNGMGYIASKHGKHNTIMVKETNNDS